MNLEPVVTNAARRFAEEMAALSDDPIVLEAIAKLACREAILGLIDDFPDQARAIGEVLTHMTRMHGKPAG